MRCTRRPIDAKLACAYVVTYPTKYKQLRATLSRSSLRGVHATIRSNEGLGMEHELPHRCIRNADSGTQNHSVRMRCNLFLFCSARCCGGSEGIEATWYRCRVTRGWGSAPSWIRTFEKSPYSITYAQRPANHCSARVLGSENVRRSPEELDETYPKSRPLSKSELSDTVGCLSEVRRCGLQCSRP